MKRNTVIGIWLTSLMLCMGLVMFRCTNALKDVEIAVNASLFKYKTLFNITSSSGAKMEDATITLSGEDASRIFDLNGHKNFKVKGSVLGLAVDPSNPPTESHSIEFNLIIKKSGYSTINLPVEITVADSGSASHYVLMINHAKPPEGVEVKNITMKVNDGKVIKDTVIYVGPGTCTCTTGKTTVKFKKGAAFKGLDGSVIGGNNGNPLSSIQITSLYVEASMNDALKAFPGGDLTQKKVKVENGSFLAGTLLPAGLIELSMTAAGKEIKGFTTPIDITIRLNPDFINPQTNQRVKVGDQLKVFSYSTANGYFQFETTGKVEKYDEDLYVHFLVDHLSWFMVGDFTPACNSSIATEAYNNTALSNLIFKIKAAWLAKGASTPVTLKIYSTKNGGTGAGTETDLLIYSLSGAVKDGQELPARIIPGMPIIVQVYDASGDLMFSTNISDPCSLASGIGGDGSGQVLTLNQTAGSR
jgi:hypothetical protein